jgi:hypothetical protein
MTPTDEQARRARTSAMVDGQLDDAQAQRWLQDEASQGDVLQDWHAYHLIGDVMRSPDLATAPGHDARLLEGVRNALQQEPVVLAPTALGGRAIRPRWRIWGAAAAAVAGVAVVLSAYLVTRVDTISWGSVVAVVTQPVDDIWRASWGSPSAPGASAQWPAEPNGSSAGSSAGFREILRLPRGPAGKPLESVQVLYSNGSATISVTVEPFKPGEHLPRTESSERLNTLSMQRQGSWLTLSGDVPIGTLQQLGQSLPAQP